MMLILVRILLWSKVLVIMIFIELVSKMHDAGTREAYCDRIPVNRYGTPDEVAATAVFLVSEEAGYISGVVMPIDGGFMGGGVIKRQANPGS